MLGQLVAFFAIFCAFVLLPAVVLGWSVATRWLDLQQELLQLEREKVRLLTEQARATTVRSEQIPPVGRTDLAAEARPFPRAGPSDDRTS